MEGKTIDWLRRNNLGQTGGVCVGSEVGDWQSVEKQILQGKGEVGR